MALSPQGSLFFLAEKSDDGRVMLFGLKPMLESLNLPILLFTEFFYEPARALRLLAFPKQLILPAPAEYEVGVVVEISALQDFPLVFVKPKTATITASVQVEINSVAYSVPGQYLAAFGANTGVVTIQHVEVGSLFLRLFGQIFTMGVQPFPILIGFYPMSRATGTFHGD